MNSQELYELLRLNPDTIAEPEEYWALFSTAFYENVFSKINDTRTVENTYNRLSRNSKIKGKAQDALEFFYKLRMDELENPDFWQKAGMAENMKAKLVKEGIYDGEYKDPNEVCMDIKKIISIVEKNMREYGALANDWRHFFDDLQKELLANSN